eukprot:TRINITY_DN73706_c0_g1_i1.p1 TRINITY_DN73706_c0_g1~~TRINITY_DN73706_c0_g1_i1.p1  ORF type:complete len:361 (-),score=63.11 TRINITY_DN73706_c0_g1_i1:212-1294(-)
MASSTMNEFFSKVRWYHVAGGVATTVAFNGSVLFGMGSAYKTYFSDQEEEARRFKKRYGDVPSERQRLELIRWMAPKWDSTIGTMERTSADVYRLELFGSSASAVVRGDVLEVAIGTGRCFDALQAAHKAAVAACVDTGEAVTTNIPAKASKVDPAVDAAIAGASSSSGSTTVDGDSIAVNSSSSADTPAAVANPGARATGITSFVGVDCVQEMLEVARGKLGALEFPARVELADAHRLPFPDSSFDAVIGSLCLCSVERPTEALSEMARVCRPDGRVLLLEPGLADWRIIRAAQRYLNLVPAAKHAWEVGWYDDLDPPALLAESSQLKVERIQTRAMGNWYLVTAKPSRQVAEDLEASG